MKFKKFFVAMLSFSMLACLSACGDVDSSSDKAAEIVTETVAVNDKETEPTDESIDKELSESENDSENSGLVLDNSNSDSDNESSSSDVKNTISDLAKNYDNEHPEDTIIPMLKMGFEVSFKDNINITYDESTSNYTVSVWLDGFADILEATNGKSSLDSMMSSLESSFSIMVENIRRLDSDANITFNFVSDKDNDKILFTFYNDKMTYCITD